MKKVNLKKYTIFIIACFFSLISFVAAASSLEVETSFGYTHTFGKDYEGLVCSEAGLNYFDITKKSAGYEVSQVKIAESAGYEEISCTYTRNKKVSGDVNGELSVKLKYVAGAPKDEITKTYDFEDLEDKYDLISKLHADKIVGIEADYGAEYVDYETNCQFTDGVATSCFISADPTEFKNAPFNNYYTVLIVNYTKEGSDLVRSAVYQFNIKGPGVAVAHYNYKLEASKRTGTCNFGDNWAKSEYYWDGKMQYTYINTAEEAYLPNCTANTGDNLPPVVFKGWMITNKGTTGISIDMNDYVNLYAVGTCSGDKFVEVGEQVKGGLEYAPCYEIDDFVQVAFHSGELVNNGSWKKINDGSYYYSNSGEGATVELPDIALDSDYNSDLELECYISSKTGKCDKKPGDPVPLDNTKYTAKLTKKYVELDTFKTVRVDKTVVFAVEGMTSCEVEGGTSEYLEATMNNSDCNVKGIKETPDNEYVTVIAHLDGDNVRRYLFSVEDMTFIMDGGNSPYIIGSEVNNLDENRYSDSGDFQTNSCANYKITGASYPSDRNYSFATYNGVKLRSSSYGIGPDSCADDPNTYLALCLDPGKAEPANGSQYNKVADLSVDSELGKLVSYLHSLGTLPQIMRSGVTNSDFIAVHVATRIVAINSGYGTGVESGDGTQKYAQYYEAYSLMAQNIRNLGKNYTKEQAKNALENGISWQDTSALDKIADILAAYQGYTPPSADQFERVNNEVTTVQTGDKGYTVTYKGHFFAPNGTEITNMEKPANTEYVTFGLEFDNSNFETVEGGRKYNYVVTITVSDAYKVKLPTTQEEMKKLSYKISFQGGGGLDNIFIARSGASSDYQGMLVFNLDSTEFYAYFNIAPNDCDMPGLDYTQCTGADSCPEDKFNKYLFKASNCCRFVTDEQTYKYVVHSVCNGECTTSTMTSVCSYDTSNVGSADLYEIKEGSSYNEEESDPYEDAISTCIVNVGDYSRAGDKSAYKKVDDANNERNIDIYDDNEYCQVTCKEDWQLTMDSFGNYVGVNAVAAGNFFQIDNNDMFIGGSRTCYTTFINYDKFLNDIYNLSMDIVAEYNNYANLAHSYTDLELQKQYKSSTPAELEITLDGNKGAYNMRCTEWYQKYKCEGDSHDSSPEFLNADGNCLTDEGNICPQGTTHTDQCKWSYTSTSYTSTYSCPNGGSRSGTTCTKTNSKSYCSTEVYASSTCGASWHTCKNYPKSERSGSKYKCYSGGGSSSYTATETKHYSCASGYENLNGDDTNSTCVKVGDSVIDTAAGEGGQGYVCPNDNSFFAYTSHLSVGQKGTDLFGDCNEENATDVCNPDSLGNSDGNYTEQSASPERDNEREYYFAGSIDNKKDEGASAQYSWGPVTNKSGECKVTTDYINGDTYTGICYTDGSAGSTENWVEEISDLAKNDAIMKSFEELHAEWSDNLKGESLGAIGAVNGMVAQIRRKVEDMYECQHFQLYNRTDENREGYSSTIDLSGTIYQTSKGFVTIPSDYDPEIDYSYAEDAYYKKLLANNDNVLEQYKKKNDNMFGGEEGAYGRATNETIQVPVFVNGETLKDGSGNDVLVDLSRNDVKSVYMKTNSGVVWPAETKVADTYGKEDPDRTLEKRVEIDWEGSSDISASSTQALFNSNGLFASRTFVVCTGTADDYTTVETMSKNGPVASSAAVYDGKWHGGHCYYLTVPYLKATYIESSISNSSFFKNKGKWFENIQDIKEHGDDLADALKKSDLGLTSSQINAELDSGRWTPFGSINVFPVSITTPRNLYTYTYTFKSIGSFDDGSLGRIMGSKVAIIANNDRTCFYEVFEELCLCCGDEINTHVYDDEDSSDVLSQFLDIAGAASNYGYKTSNVDSMRGNSNSSMGFASTSVNLSDVIAGTSDIPASSNWGDSAAFSYSGESNLTTGKGQVLMQIVEEQGETIYGVDVGAEYSYILTPSTLSSIRDYNDSNGYEVNYNNLSVYGRYPIAAMKGCSDGSSASCWEAEDEEMNNEIINFQHYGSKFLEDFMYNEVNNAVIVGPKDYSTSLNNCFVVESDGGISADTIQNMVSGANKCRWIDYVENIGNNSGKGKTSFIYSTAMGSSDAGVISDNTVQYFRLAFK